MKNYIMSIIVCTLLITSCNDSFLEKLPINSQTEATAFVTNDNFETFAWSFYDIFTDAPNFVMGFGNYGTNYRGDMYAGYLSQYTTTEPNNYRKGTLVAPASGNGWTFGYIRRLNLMLTNIDGSQMTEEQKNHWRSVGYFFRAFRYYELVSRFGDVPWIEEVINESQSDIIYGTRTPRKEVTDNILSNLQFAEANINANGNGENTINTDVVRALMSRFCLFEGTWRKYHGLGDHEKFLEEAIRVSELLAAKYPTISNNFDALLNTNDLSGFPGVIFYKQYEPDVIKHGSSHTERTSSGSFEMPKYSVEMYLCQDGKTIHNSMSFS